MVHNLHILRRDKQLFFRMYSVSVDFVRLETHCTQLRVAYSFSVVYYIGGGISHIIFVLDSSVYFITRINTTCLAIGYRAVLF